MTQKNKRLEKIVDTCKESGECSAQTHQGKICLVKNKAPIAKCPYIGEKVNFFDFIYYECKRNGGQLTIYG